MSNEPSPPHLQPPPPRPPSSETITVILDGDMYEFQHCKGTILSVTRFPDLRPEPTDIAIAHTPQKAIYKFHARLHHS